MFGRTWFLIVLFALGLAAVAWAVYSSRLPPADFSFVNETEVATVDPALANGQPEMRIIQSLFEGLARQRPTDAKAAPGIAELPDISSDGRVYTFHLRKNAVWSNGEHITAHDSLYSIRRLIDPLTYSRYPYLGWHIANAKKYSLNSMLVPGDRVEVELNPAADLPNTVRGELLFGTLVRNKTAKVADKKPEDGGDRIFVVKIGGKERRFQAAAADEKISNGAERCRQVLLDFREVGIKVIDDFTLEIRLANPTPYFLDLLAYYPFATVNKRCLEKYGSPAWTRPENIVTGGPFRLVARRIRDRVRLVRSDNYWDREHVKLHTVDALSIDNRTTALNLYMTSAIDWVTVPPAEVIREFLKERPKRTDFNPAPQLSTYFFLLNTTRPPLNDKRVRHALSMALDRDEITRVATGAGEIPAYSLVPPSVPGYHKQECKRGDPEAARKLMAEAGYPGGRGFPRIEILYNTDQAHQAIAELVRKQWQHDLGITTTLRNEEWGSYQDTIQQLKFVVARRAWVGDYLDPNTFLDMYLTGGENNNTGFANPQYDKIIADAATEPDENKRMRIMESAERMLMEEMPIIPVYFYVSRNVVRQRVRGFYNNLLDAHPLQDIWIDPNVDDASPRPNEYMEPVK
jgi:oligopeptide transport system substrate-binding protein